MSSRSLHRFREALAEALEEQVEFPPGVLVTLVHAELTGDMRYGKGILSVLPESGQEEALKAVKRHQADIKQALNKKLRLRKMPELHWSFDDTEAKAAEIEEMLNSLQGE